MIAYLFIAALVGLAAYIVWMRRQGQAGPAANGGPDVDGAPAAATPREQADRPKPRYRAYTPPPPETPRILSSDAAKDDFDEDEFDEDEDEVEEDESGAAADDAYDDFRAFEQVSTSCYVLDIAPDGREAMTLHDGDAVTIYDVASGKALKTWRNICPPEWTAHFGEDSCFSCAGRRLFWGWMEDDRHLNILIDLEKGEVRRIYDTADGEQAIGSAAMSADGRFVFGTAIYSEDHPAFDLDKAPEVGEDEGGGGGFGDYRLEPGTIWPEVAIAPDGRFAAFEIGDGDVQTIALQDEPDTETLAKQPAWAWPDYLEHMQVSGDDSADRLAFSDDGALLLVLERDGGLILADMAAADFRLLKPFGDDLGDNPVFFAVTWVRGRMAAIIEIMAPTPRLVRVDLEAGAIDAEWPVTEDMLQRMRVSPTGDYALLNGPNGVIRVVPLPG